MAIFSAAYVHVYPFIPGGGMFFIPVGLCLILGAFVPRARMPLVWLGFTLGIAAIVVGGGKYLRDLPPPSTLQLSFFVGAILAEIAGFSIVMPRLRPFGQRAMLVGTLAIVGAHFLIMIPTFGISIAVLAALCLANAAIAGRMPAYPISAAWLIDGVFKLAAGLIMWSASPAFH